MSTPNPLPEKLTLKVIAVGGAGQNALNHVLAGDVLPGAEFAALNTDAAALASCRTNERFVLGAARTRGLGCGGDVGLGRASAEDDMAMLRALCGGCRMVFVLAGLGGGCGTGAAPVVARLARDSGALVLAVVTLPFEFEGNLRKFNAEQGLKELRSAADAVIALPNQRLRALLDERTSAAETFSHANELLSQSIAGIWRLLNGAGPLKLDFANLEKFLRGRHVESAFATVESRGEVRGESRAIAAVDELLRHPFLEQGRALSEADGVLVSIASGPELGTGEMDRITVEIQKRCRDGVHWVLGANIDPAMAGRFQLSVIATRQAAKESPEPLPTRSAPGPVDSVAPRTADPAGLGGELFNDPSEPRPESRHAAQPPELSPQLKQVVIGRNARGRRRKRGEDQPELDLFVVARSRFAETAETVHNRQNLDEPTFLRRGMALN